MVHFWNGNFLMQLAHAQPVTLTLEVMGSTSMWSDEEEEEEAAGVRLDRWTQHSSFHPTTAEREKLTVLGVFVECD